jgi:dethiobiotin synthetase
MRVIFITATDTGVGKTLLTGLLLHHLRQANCRALAIKPFCSGGTRDVDFLHALQDGLLTRSEINPFYFSQPVAPLIALRRRRRNLPLREVLQKIRQVGKRAECLLIEGSGGLLVPLGEGYTVRDLICRLRCDVIVVARNRLGTINHTLLTVESLREAGIRSIQIALMESAPGTKDPSCATNAAILTELLRPLPLVRIPFLDPSPLDVSSFSPARLRPVIQAVTTPRLNGALTALTSPPSRRS